MARCQESNYSKVHAAAEGYYSVEKINWNMQITHLIQSTNRLLQCTVAHKLSL